MTDGRLEEFFLRKTFKLAIRETFINLFRGGIEMKTDGLNMVEALKVLKAGEEKIMSVVFIIEPAIDEGVHEISLSYTFFIKTCLLREFLFLGEQRLFPFIS